MSRKSLDDLSRRERQIMDILLELGEASVEDVRRRLPEPPSYSSARAMLGKLEGKGFARHSEENLRYVYSPAIPRSQARRSAARRLVRVFYEGSLAQAVAGLLESTTGDISEEELDRLSKLVEEARAERSKGDSA